MYRRGGLGDTTVLSPNLNIALNGSITIDGHELAVRDAQGGQSHLWGRKHAHSWAWGHCNGFEGRPDAALEALTVRLKRGSVITPKLSLISLYLGSEAFRFTEFHDLMWTRGSYRTGEYQFRVAGPLTRIEGAFHAAPVDFVQATYADPDGEASYCCNTELADLHVSVWKRSTPLSSWRKHAELSAPRRGHFEVGERVPDALVTARHRDIDDADPR